MIKLLSRTVNRVKWCVYVLVLFFFLDDMKMEFEVYNIYVRNFHQIEKDIFPFFLLFKFIADDRNLSLRVC